MTKTHRLVRKRLEYGPDGESVTKTDTILVEITWPEPTRDIPLTWHRETGSPYRVLGDWCVVDEGEVKL